MYKLKLTHHFDAAHQLKLDYDSPCMRLHGHRWDVIVRIEAGKLNDNGMICDFGEIKEVINKLDHQNLSEILPSINSTAENIAFYLHSQIEDVLKRNKVRGMVWVEVYESPNASIEYGHR